MRDWKVVACDGVLRLYIYSGNIPELSRMFRVVCSGMFQNAMSLITTSQYSTIGAQQIVPPAGDGVCTVKNSENLCAPQNEHGDHSWSVVLLLYVVRRCGLVRPRVPRQLEEAPVPDRRGRVVPVSDPVSCQSENAVACPLASTASVGR